MSKLIKLYILLVAISALVAPPDTLSDHHDEDSDVTEQTGKTGAEDRESLSTALGPGLQRLVDLAVTDLATNLSVEEETIEVVEAQFVTWRDSSAGCPKPGMQYLQVLTNGARMLLRANGTTYHYHSSGSRSPFHCAKPAPIKPLPYSHGEV